MTSQTTNSTQSTLARRDVSGFAVFSTGDTGEAHVMAHRFFDQSDCEQGYRWLGDWLATHAGAGSDWVHLQFHMALFELAVGHWDAAHARFTNEIVPVAATTDDALTDAPALAWRLSLAAPRPAAIDWDELRRTALRRADCSESPFTELHHLLAYAGADDVASIERWLSRNHRRDDASLATTVLTNMATALTAWCHREYSTAASVLRRTVPRLPRIGGSHAQQQLFVELERAARRHAAAAAPAVTYRKAA
jgi:hypothetical protein